MERSWQSHAISGLAHVCAASLLFALSVPIAEHARKPARTVALIAPVLRQHVSIAPPHRRQEAKLTVPRIASAPIALPRPAAENPPPAAKPAPRVLQAVFEPPKAFSLQVPLDTPPPVAELPVAPTVEVHTGAFAQAAAPAQTSNQHAVVSVGAFGGGSSTQSGGEAGGNARAGVRLGGFGDQTTRPAGNHPVRQPQAAAYTPVEILFKPKPIYTMDARNSRVEGEVSLEVVFLATGEIRVGRVVQGLGHGLDEAAQQAASLVRFRPATRGGVPVDTPAVIRITFELT